MCVQNFYMVNIDVPAGAVAPLHDAQQEYYNDSSCVPSLIKKSSYAYDSHLTLAGQTTAILMLPLSELSACDFWWKLGEVQDAYYTCCESFLGLHPQLHATATECTCCSCDSRQPNIYICKNIIHYIFVPLNHCMGTEHEMVWLVHQSIQQRFNHCPHLVS